MAWPVNGKIVSKWATSLQMAGHSAIVCTQAPVGNEEAAVLLRSVGSRPSFTFPPQDHLALGERLGLIDFEAGARVTGAK